MEPGLTDNRLGDSSSVPADDISDGLADDLRARIKAEIEPGERLLWAARSSPPPVPLDAGTVFSVVAVVLLLAAVVGIFILRADAFGYLRLPLKDGLFAGLLASLVGCALAIGKIYAWIKSRAEQRRRANVCYAVTDRRAVFLIPEPKTDAVRVIVLPRGEIADLVRVEHPDGFGTLELSTPSFAGRLPWYPLGFQNIPKVRRVEQIVRTNLMTSKGRSRAIRGSEPDLT